MYQAEETAESKKIALSDSGITVDGAAISDDETAAVYAAQDIVYYEEGQGVAYGAGTDADAHSQEEADAHTVVHITQPGTYPSAVRCPQGRSLWTWRWRGGGP